MSRPTYSRRQILASAAAATASLSVLASCSSNNGGGGALGSGGGTGVAIVVPTSQAPWNPAYAELVAKYTEDTGNEVTLRPVPNEALKTQQLNDIQSQQHTFDVYQINESDMVQFMENKWVQPFTDVDPNFELDPNIYTYDNLPFWDEKTQSFSPDGVVTSVPILGNLQLFMYRKDIYDKLGLTVPTTWEEIVANGEKAVAAGDTEYGGAFRLQASTNGSPAITYDFQAIFNGQGAKWFKDEGKDWTPQVNSPEGIKAATILRQLAELGPKDTTTMGQAQAIAVLQAGDAAQTYLVAAAAPQLENEANSNVVGKMGYTSLPLTPEGTAGSATGLWSLGIPTGLPPERAKAALDFINWVTSKDAMTFFAEKGGIPTRSDAYEPEGVSPATQEYFAAIKETAGKKPVGQTRYAFAPEMLTITEPILGNIAAGKVSPEDGMQQMQRELTAMATKKGLAMG